MKATKFVCLFTVIVVMLSALCGCNSTYKSVESLMKPPYAQGELGEIQKAFYKIADEDTKLLTPAVGDYTNSFTLFDIDNDKTNEAFVFYSSSDDIAHAMVLKKNNKNWEKIDDFEGYGTTIDFVKFVDMNNNEYPEIIIGWVISDNGVFNKTFSVYSYNLKSGKYPSMANEQYTIMDVYDLNLDGKKEIISVLSNMNNEVLKPGAMMYQIQDDNTFTLVSECKLDSSVTSYSGMHFENSVLYLDAFIGELQMITEVIAWDIQSGSIINPFFDENFGTNRKTWRRIPAFITDINNDKKIDIPTQSFELYSSDSNIVNYDCIKWKHYSNKELYEVKTSIVDLYGQYIINVPKDIEKSVSLSYNKAEKSLTVLYNDYYGSREVIKIFELSISEWDKTEEKKFTLLKKNNKSVFAYALTKEGYDLGLSAKYIETNFRLL